MLIDVTQAGWKCPYWRLTRPVRNVRPSGVYVPPSGVIRAEMSLDSRKVSFRSSAKSTSKTLERYRNIVGHANKVEQIIYAGRVGHWNQHKGSTTLHISGLSPQLMFLIQHRSQAWRHEKHIDRLWWSEPSNVAISVLQSCRDCTLQNLSFTWV